MVVVCSDPSGGWSGGGGGGEGDERGCGCVEVKASFGLSTCIVSLCALGNQNDGGGGGNLFALPFLLCFNFVLSESVGMHKIFDG